MPPSDETSGEGVDFSLSLQEQQRNIEAPFGSEVMEIPIVTSPSSPGSNSSLPSTSSVSSTAPSAFILLFLAPSLLFFLAAMSSSKRSWCSGDCMRFEGGGDGAWRFWQQMCVCDFVKGDQLPD